jgi:hypothetical protein
MVMFWKNKEKIKQEKLENLYKRVEEYLKKIYNKNFEPNMFWFRRILHNNNEEFQKNFSTFFADFDRVFVFEIFKEKITNNEKFVKPMVLKDYMDFFNEKTIKYNVKNLVSYTMTKFDGTTFEVSDEDIVDIIFPNTIVWKDDSTEIMQKITPNYTFEEKELVWTWDDLTYEDIQNHFIDFKTEEERIFNGEE